MYTQTVTPDPNIPCQPGWCLQYVRQTFGAPAVHPTATAAWESSPTQHPDRDFPADMWVPVWYGLDKEPAGHVVLRAPDGSVYSTSDLKNTPHHHPSLEDLEQYYAYYGMKLTYRGWTEDIENTTVVEEDMTQEEKTALLSTVDKIGAWAEDIDNRIKALPPKQWFDDQINATARIDAVSAKLDQILAALGGAK